MKSEPSKVTEIYTNNKAAKDLNFLAFLLSAGDFKVSLERSGYDGG